jgi:pyruvate formate lyase activating enzyme
MTGGEPTQQFEPLKVLLTLLKTNSINTAMETNGTHPRLPELFPLLDTLIIDIKHHDAIIHSKELGLGNERILSNIKEAGSAHSNLWIRIPLIPGFISSIAPKASVEFLPYHEYGTIKWEQCSMKYTLKGKRIEKGAAALFSKFFAESGIKTIKT